MAKDLLEEYNRYRYRNELPEDDGFVSFLYKNISIIAPDVDVDAAWGQLRRNLSKKTRSNMYWWKIAVSVILLAGVSLIILDFYTRSELLTVHSNEKKQEVKFSDGSIGILNRNSSFSFKEKFGKERLVNFQGEAYFDIRKNQSPFIIRAGKVNVRVLGTAFNLLATHQKVELYVERGLVAFEKDGKQTEVQAGLMAIFHIKDDTITLTKTPPSNIMGWRSGVFEFDDVPLKFVLEDLSTYYPFTYAIQNDRLAECKLTASFNQSTISEIIYTIESILEVTVILDEKRMKISGKGC